MLCFSLSFALPVNHTFTCYSPHRLLCVCVWRRNVSCKRVHTWLYILCVYNISGCVLTCTWAYCGHIVNTAKWCPLKSLALFLCPRMCVSVCSLACIHSSHPALCAWLDHRALTHGCPSGNQICHVAKRGHQVAMLSGSTVPRRSPGRYPRNTLERWGGGAADGGQAAAH